MWVYNSVGLFGTVQYVYNAPLYMARYTFGLVFLFKRKGLQKIDAAQISLSRYYERNEEHSEIRSTPGFRFQYVHTYFTPNFFNEF
jgi:hypothetical protein